MVFRRFVYTVPQNTVLKQVSESVTQINERNVSSYNISLIFTPLIGYQYSPMQPAFQVSMDSLVTPSHGEKDWVLRWTVQLLL